MEKLQKISPAEYYNSIAHNYDEQLEKGLLEKIIRKKFQEKLLNNFKPGDKVLELCCGTGIDTIFLSKFGIKITATDISTGMIEVTNRKIKNENLSEFTKTFIMDAEDIGTCLNEKYDGAFSNFNGLNYILNLNRFANNLARVINPHGKVQFTLLKKRCLWKFIYYLIKLKPFTAFEFLRKREKNYVNGMKLYSPGKFKKYFTQYFQVKSIMGFGLLIPPDGLIGLQKKFYRLFKKIEKLDILLASIYPFRNFCDHFIIEMERNENMA